MFTDLIETCQRFLKTKNNHNKETRNLEQSITDILSDIRDLYLGGGSYGHDITRFANIFNYPNVNRFIADFAKAIDLNKFDKFLEDVIEQILELSSMDDIPDTRGNKPG